MNDTAISKVSGKNRNVPACKISKVSLIKWQHSVGGLAGKIVRFSTDRRERVRKRGKGEGSDRDRDGAREGEGADIRDAAGAQREQKGPLASANLLPSIPYLFRPHPRLNPNKAWEMQFAGQDPQTMQAREGEAGSKSQRDQELRVT